MSDPGDATFVPKGYRMLHRLGAGQTSHVYLADHVHYGRVALKLPRPELESKPVLRRMFENEVMITLRLDHPSVVKALDGHPTGRGAYLGLEMCPGGTLDQLLLEKGRLPLDQALRLVEDVAAGLAYTHAQKVLHRDVKPANVFLTDTGRAKLGDFGTGTFVGEEASERVGTAFYMAPEVFEGASASVRSDVYGLGVLAYEVLTGERPFRGESYEALMHAHLGGLLRDPASVRTDLPKGVASVIRTAMARLPERRYAGVAPFLTALIEATPDLRPGPRSEAAPRAGRVGRSTRIDRAPRVDETPGTGGRADEASRTTRHDGVARGKGATSDEEGARPRRRGGFWRWLLGDRD